jgi:hypothetical protein
MGISMSFKSILATNCGFFVLSAALVPLLAHAVDTPSHAPSPKRQLVMCMTKRMTDSKTLSYNAAAKMCKEQLEAQQVTLTTSVLAKPMAP